MLSTRITKDTNHQSCFPFFRGIAFLRARRIERAAHRSTKSRSIISTKWASFLQFRWLATYCFAAQVKVLRKPLGLWSGTSIWDSEKISCGLGVGVLMWLESKFERAGVSEVVSSWLRTVGCGPRARYWRFINVAATKTACHLP